MFVVVVIIFIVRGFVVVVVVVAVIFYLCNIYTTCDIFNIVVINNSITTPSPCYISYNITLYYTILY
jgi:hypothetical protein